MTVFSVLVHVLVHVLVDVLVHVLVNVLVCDIVYFLVRVRVNIKYGAFNIYFLHGKYIVDSQGLYEVAWKLKGLLHESGWVKSAENISL